MITLKNYHLKQNIVLKFWTGNVEAKINGVHNQTSFYVNYNRLKP